MINGSKKRTGGIFLLIIIIIIIINEEKIRATLSHRDVAGALYMHIV